jgi:hypothetical protein
MPCTSSNPASNFPNPSAKGFSRQLVDAQDHKLPVGKSRQLVAARFRVSESQVQEIEQEGLESTWPPLGT